MYRPLLGVGLLALSSAAPILAQTPTSNPDASANAFASRAGDIDAALAAWRAAHGASWRSVHDSATGYARFLHGGMVAPAFTPTSDAQWLELARASFASAAELMGIEAATLGAGRVDFLPLALIGSSNKVSVEFRQHVNGVRVQRGFANALYDVDGNLLSLDTTGLPDVAQLDTTPELGADAALAAATVLFQRQTGLAPTLAYAPELVIDRESDGKLVRGALAWEVKLYWERDGYPTQGWVYRLAARGEPRVMSDETLVHQDVGGTVSTLATPGNGSATPSNLPVADLMRYARVTSSAGTRFTDVNGAFNYAGVNTPLQVTITYVGTYNNVQNANGSEYSLTVTLQPNQANTVLLNPTPTADILAQANAFQSVNEFHDWIIGINASDPQINFVAQADVNGSPWCNAQWVGNETQYYLPEGSCANTAFQSVVYHETGHWMNERYGSGNGSDGFGEGNADVYSMYLTDDPIIGENFSCVGPTCYIRTGENTRQFCGDTNPGCYGEVHADGEVLMGALWKVRKQLDAALGNSAGDARSSFLFNAWMNAFNDGQINSIIEAHWLTVDDNDGFIDNGTPNFAAIDAGFKQQGFPGYELPKIQMSNMTHLADTKDQAGPYGVQVQAVSGIGGSVTGVALKYSVNGSPFLSLPMTWNGSTGFSVLVPGIASPAKVRYYTEAIDNLGNTQTFPKAGASAAFSFGIGTTKTVFFDNLEQSGDNGWTHAQVATQDDWQKGDPAGKSGTSQGVAWRDPDQPASGTQLWANDLGNTISGTTWGGSYNSNVSNWIRSPSINCSQAFGTVLKFKRWLSVEKASFDKATIKVGGTQVWQNPVGADISETAWSDFEVDISAQADGKPAVQIEWSLVSDGGLELGGWAFDDVAIQAMDPSPTACLPTFYGSGLAGTNGTPVLDSAGEPLALGNAAFQVKLKNARANSACWIALGFTNANVPVLGGTLLVLPAFTFPRTSDVFGQVSVSLPLANDPTLAGLACYFQAVVADGAAAQGFAFTQGLQGAICP